MKTFLKQHLPFIANGLKTARQWYFDGKAMKPVFESIHDKRTWDELESISGPGSTLRQTAALRADLPLLLQEIDARTMLDAPCGDFNWMKEVNLNLDYTGADIVKELVQRNQQHYSASNRRFVELDISRDKLPRVDVILCRDCLVHFSFKVIYSALNNFKRSGSQYLLTTTYTGEKENINTVTGGWRKLNLQLAPFNFPMPLNLINERSTEANGQSADKSLGLWRISDLP